MPDTATAPAERCKCGHTAGAHGLRGDPGCTFCDCRHYERPVVAKAQIELGRYAKQALELLAKNPDFKGTPRDALAMMLADGHGRMYAAGMPLVQRGSTTHLLHVVLAGEVEVDPPPSDNGPATPIRAGEGVLVGDLRAFSGEERWSTIVALDNVEALEVNTTKLKPVFAEYPDLFMTLARVLARYAGNLADFDATSELVDATLEMALDQYEDTVTHAASAGIDPKKAMEIRQRWRELKDQDKEDRAREALRNAISAQTSRGKR